MGKIDTCVTPFYWQTEVRISDYLALWKFQQALMTRMVGLRFLWLDAVVTEILHHHV